MLCKTWFVTFALLLMLCRGALIEKEVVVGGNLGVTLTLSETGEMRRTYGVVAYKDPKWAPVGSSVDERQLRVSTAATTAVLVGSGAMLSSNSNSNNQSNQNQNNKNVNDSFVVSSSSSSSSDVPLQILAGGAFRWAGAADVGFFARYNVTSNSFEAATSAGFNKRVTVVAVASANGDDDVSSIALTTVVYIAGLFTRLDSQPPVNVLYVASLDVAKGEWTPIGTPLLPSAPEFMAVAAGGEALYTIGKVVGESSLWVARWQLRTGWAMLAAPPGTTRATAAADKDECRVAQAAAWYRGDLHLIAWCGTRLRNERRLYRYDDDDARWHALAMPASVKPTAMRTSHDGTSLLLWGEGGLHEYWRGALLPRWTRLIDGDLSSADCGVADNRTHIVVTGNWTYLGGNSAPMDGAAIYGRHSKELSRLGVGLPRADAYSVISTLPMIDTSESSASNGDIFVYSSQLVSVQSNLSESVTEIALRSSMSRLGAHDTAPSMSGSAAWQETIVDDLYAQGAVVTLVANETSGDVYIGGAFESFCTPSDDDDEQFDAAAAAASSCSPNILRWDGERLYPVGSGTTSYLPFLSGVSRTLIVGDQLYASGFFAVLAHRAPDSSSSSVDGDGGDDDDDLSTVYNFARYHRPSDSWYAVPLGNWTTGAATSLAPDDGSGDGDGDDDGGEDEAATVRDTVLAMGTIDDKQMYVFVERNDTSVIGTGCVSFVTTPLDGDGVVRDEWRVLPFPFECDQWVQGVTLSRRSIFVTLLSWQAYIEALGGGGGGDDGLSPAGVVWRFDVASGQWDSEPVVQVLDAEMRSGYVLALAIDVDTERLYVGGMFALINSSHSLGVFSNVATSAPGVALPPVGQAFRPNYTQWSPLAAGVKGAITAMQLDTGPLRQLVVIGPFESASGVSARNVAVWTPHNASDAQEGVWGGLGVDQLIDPTGNVLALALAPIQARPSTPSASPTGNGGGDESSPFWTTAVIVSMSVGAALLTTLLVVALAFGVVFWRRRQRLRAFRYFEIPDVGKPQVTLANLLDDPSVRKVDWDSIEMGELLGSGASGQVFAATMNGARVAVKRTHLGRGGAEQSDEELVGEFLLEIKILSTLRHENILPFLGVAVVPGTADVVLVSPLMERGSLANVNRAALPLQLKMAIAIDIARGIDYLHAQQPPLIHRDIKVCFS
jgi:Protein tyrosine and serine/threonine kinase